MANPLSSLDQPLRPGPNDGILIPTSGDKVARCSEARLRPVQIGNQVPISLRIMVVIQITVDTNLKIQGPIGEEILYDKLQ